MYRLDRRLPALYQILRIQMTMTSTGQQKVNVMQRLKAEIKINMNNTIIVITAPQRIAKEKASKRKAIGRASPNRPAQQEENKTQTSPSRRALSFSAGRGL